MDAGSASRDKGKQRVLTSSDVIDVLAFLERDFPHPYLSHPTPLFISRDPLAAGKETPVLRMKISVCTKTTAPKLGPQ